MRVFITHIVPKDKVRKYHVPAAPVYFSYNLIDGGVFDKVFSILPANIVAEKKDLCDERVETVYSSWRGKKILHRFAPLIEDLILFPKIPKDANVWFYNINMLTALLVMLLGIFKPSVKRYTIMLDYTPGAKWNGFLLNLINRSRGIISLSTSELFTVKNSCILPGVVFEDNDFTKVSAPITRDFLLSGNLNEQICMLHMILPAFAKMPGLNLHITGFSGDEEYIKLYTDKYSNIKKYGMLDYDAFIDLMHHCPFLLSTRNPEFPENACNFPSKIIEGLLHNRIVISTIHYEQLAGIKYIEVPYDIDGFVEIIQQWSLSSDDILLSFANQAEETYLRYNTKVWKEKMELIEKNSD